MDIVGKPVSAVDTPALLLDFDKVERNITKMASFFDRRNSTLRPHFKTHKTPVISHLQLEAGAKGITCQKLGEAEVLANSGIKDILITNQIVGKRKIERLVNLASWTDVKVLVDDEENVEMIDKAASEVGGKVGILVEVDVGMNRCGVEPGDEALALSRTVERKENLEFRGLEGYEGHAVLIRDYQTRKRKTDRALAFLRETKKLLEENDMKVEIVTGGATGTYMITGDDTVATEVEAGSYVTMDGRYSSVERVDFENALTVLTTVISRPDRRTAIVDAGLKAMTNDFGSPVPLSSVKMGLDDHLSEEHGKLLLEEESSDPVLGDLVEFIPSHGCTTINLHEKYYVVRDGRVSAVWNIEGRGKFT